MDTYSFLRELADSWILLAMFTFFLSAVLWALRPGSSKTYSEISQIPLRTDEECANPPNAQADDKALKETANV